MFHLVVQYLGKQTDYPVLPNVSGMLLVIEALDALVDAAAPVSDEWTRHEQYLLY